MTKRAFKVKIFKQNFKKRIGSVGHQYIQIKWPHDPESGESPIWYLFYRLADGMTTNE